MHVAVTSGFPLTVVGIFTDYHSLWVHCFEEMHILNTKVLFQLLQYWELVQTKSYSYKSIKPVDCVFFRSITTVHLRKAQIPGLLLQRGEMTGWVP